MRAFVFMWIGLSVSVLMCSCGTTSEKKPVGPQGSDDGYMPWNVPQPGEGTGGFGGAFDRR